jgi:hypothetical protein
MLRSQMSASTAKRLLATAGILASTVVALPATATAAGSDPGPAAPIVSVASHAFAELTVTATEPDGLGASSFEVTLAPVNGSHPIVDDFVADSGTPNTGTATLTQLDDVSYRVTVTVSRFDASPTGTSSASTPVTAAPFWAPAGARHERNSYVNGVATVSWDPPERDGRSPITHYRVVVECQRTFRRTVPGDVTTTRFRGIAANKICPVTIKTYNAFAGGRWNNDAELATDVGLVTSLSRTGHARWRFVTAGRAHPLGGPKLATAPSVTVDNHGHYYFLGATAKGVVYDRTLTLPWRRLDTPPCFQPALALVPPTYFDIGCRSSKGTLMYTDTSTVSRGRLVPAGILPWTDTGRHIIGGVSAAQESLSGEFVVRTSPRDAAGHDVAYFDTLDERWRPVRLSCDATPAVSGRADDFSATFGCRHSHHSVQWETTGGFPGTHVHTAQTPVRVTGALGIASFLQSSSIELAVTGVDRKVHLLNAEQRAWSTFGRAASRSLVLYAYSGSRDFSHIITTTG